ncbi:hypothetical protein [Rhabdochlamydiaceae symbiont of Dictyostelium giganteum]|uniref:hypothetical protein n=1 Tax=Rhabdochlamydiaceae symbiont of Dictyostelium giganteum TaxID=3342349 RepID=UPI003850B194
MLNNFQHLRGLSFIYEEERETVFSYEEEFLFFAYQILKKEPLSEDVIKIF